MPPRTLASSSSPSVYHCPESAAAFIRG
uniref:Uncharacterized protein n=1 Tax=Arundo donax TaxID=35708 RepID=A0A0A9HMP8_ARUDO